MTDQLIWLTYRYLPDTVNKVSIFAPMSSNSHMQANLEKLIEIFHARIDVVAKVCYVEREELLALERSFSKSKSIELTEDTPLLIVNGKILYYSIMDIEEILSKTLMHVELDEKTTEIMKLLKSSKYLI